MIGRLLDNYLLNFGVRDMVAEALDDMGFDLSVIENRNPIRHWATVAWAVWPHAS
ncbi:MAG: hypothetical protein ACLRM9_08815 [Collinsella aerofaciens]